MADQKPIYVGAIGVKIEFEVLNDDGAVVDISAAVSKTVDLVRPDDTVAATAQAATFTTDGTDGKMYYKTVAGAIIIEGTYRAQAYLDLASWSGKATIIDFEVDPALV
jgi:hypothetical protein